MLMMTRPKCQILGFLKLLANSLIYSFYSLCVVSPLDSLIIIVSTILTWMIPEQSPLDPQGSLGSDPLMTTEGVLLAHCFTFSPWGTSLYGSYYACFCVKVGVYSGVSVSPFSSYSWNTEGKKREVAIAVETRYVNKLSDILQEKFHVMQNWMET